jgi:hypothetical protein
MPHPYERFEGTPLWDAISAELTDLANNRDLVLHTAPEYVVGALCERLSRSHLVNASGERFAATSRDRFVAFLESAARGNRAGWQDFIATHYTDSKLEDARRQAALTGIRRDKGDITDAQAAEYFRILASRLRDDDSHGR